MSDVERAAQLQGLFFHTMARLPPDLATAYAHEYLVRIPLTSAALGCQIGGLSDVHWMPLRFAARDAVVALHGGAEHFAQTPAGQHVLVKNADAGGGEDIWAMTSGAKVTFGGRRKDLEPYTSANIPTPRASLS